jgi:ribosomal protein S18 acetylase RimI-like enzyme
VTTVPLPAHQLDAAAAAYTRAFMDDPFSVWVTPDPMQREHDLPLFFRMAMRFAMRYGGRVEVGDEQPRAVATWLAPAHPLPTNLGLLRTGLLGMLWAGGWSGARRFFEFGDALEGLHARDVRQPHWYLWLLAVDPPFQRKGLGGALLRPRLQAADRDGLPCYLETAKESNVSLYQRFGFEVLRERTLGTDGPRFWTMLRAPR